ncbi:hypothetical protein GOODEAATRI_017928 [Goodea atripinnis]|uniref:Uncharacterized protein n=1 Tax=Goodea atripinnis TaxID=208336 RepID=A0ABV0PZB3_9TELE
MSLFHVAPPEEFTFQAENWTRWVKRFERFRIAYGTLHDEMMRDRFAVGLRDKRLSEQLQMDPELTLEKVLNRASQSELGNVNILVIQTRHYLRRVFMMNTTHQCQMESSGRLAIRLHSESRFTEN